MSDTVGGRISIEITAGEDGKKPVSGEHRLLDVKIRKDINMIPEATLTYIDGGVAERERFELAESKLFDKGNKVTIKVGYDSKVETVFEGIVDESELNIDKTSKFVVKCLNQAHTLTNLTMAKDSKELKLEKTSVPSAIKSVLSKHKSVKSNVSLAKKPADADLQLPHIIVDPFKTTWDFIKENLGGYIAIPDDDKLRIEEPNFKQSADNNVKITYGKNLRSFKVKENTGVLQALSIKGVDPQDPAKPLKKELKASALYKDFKKYMNDDTKKSLSDIEETEFITGSHINTMAQIEFIEIAKKFLTMLAFKTGTITIHGSNKVKLAKMVKVVGLPKTHSAFFFVGGIEHRIGTDWETTIKVGYSSSNGLGKLVGGGSSNQSDFAGGPTSGAKLSGNLTLGIVKSIHEDKDQGLYKIKVKVPKLMDTEVDARMIQPFAGGGTGGGEGEGTFFFPNVGSQVVMTPLEGDENDWLVLGGLYGPKNKPATELKKGSDPQPDQKNSHKSIVTKEFLFDFCDDEKDPSFTVSGRGKTEKYSIAMHTKDKSNITLSYDKTKVVLDEKGILINSDKDIILEAKGNIEMKGTNFKYDGQKFETKAGSVKSKIDTKYEMEAMQVGLKGKVQANLESGAMVNVKGTPLNLKN